MLTVKDINPDPNLSVYIAVAFAKEVLYIFEEEYPKDLRPRKAIEVTEAYLREEEVSAASAYAAASAASGSAYAGSAGSAAYYVASCVSSAASAASSAASSATAVSASYATRAAYVASANSSTTSATSAALDAAFYAAKAANAAKIVSAYTSVTKGEYIHERLLKMLPFILQYKIENQQSFNNPEKVLEYLNEEQQTVALFHLDSLV